MSMLVETLIEFGVVVAVGFIAIHLATRRRLTSRETWIAEVDSAYDARVAEVDSAYDVVVGETSAHRMQTHPIFAGWGSNIHTDIVNDRHL